MPAVEFFLTLLEMARLATAVIIYKGYTTTLNDMWFLSIVISHYASYWFNTDVAECIM